jgi:hypothetical protein
MPGAATPTRRVTRAGNGVKVETVPRYYLDAGDSAGMSEARHRRVNRQELAGRLPR